MTADTVQGERLRHRLAMGLGSVKPPLGLAVSGLVVASLATLPIAYLAVRALGADAGAIDLVLRPRTLQVLASTVALALAVGIATALIGVPLAWLTTRTDLPLRRMWLVATVVPLAIPSYVIAFALVAAFGPTGALQGALAPFGVGRLPSIYGLPGAALVLTLAGYPYVLLSARAALLRTDPAVEEAARALGDSRSAVFRRVTLPLAGPAVAAGMLLAILYALSDFGAVAILQFDSFAREIYIQYRASLDRTVAAVLALMLVGVTFLVASGEAHIRRRSRTPAHGSRRPPTVVSLGSLRWPSVVFCAGVVGVALVVPAGTILFWLLRGLAQGEPLRLVAGTAGNSLLAGSASAVTAALLALPVAFLIVRYPGRVATIVERLVYGAYALPGIAIALAVVFFVARVTPLVYQSLLVLVLAYAVRFLPQATGTARSSLLQIGPRLGEVARSLGQGPLGVFRTVTLPLLRPGLVAGGALVFLTTVKELPMTLLLAPIGFDTLATQIWSAATEGFYARAAAPAAMLLALSAGTVAVLLRAEDVGA
ncbi:iron ABC transporter permease [soil metagenome]